MTAREPLPLEPLPCPFCGCAKIEWLGYLSNSLLRCTQCGCTSDDGSRERVIAAWNRRPPSAREEVIEECARVALQVGSQFAGASERRGCRKVAQRIRALAGGKQ
jgi:hypothetical protein